MHTEKLEIIFRVNDASEIKAEIQLIEGFSPDNLDLVKIQAKLGQQTYSTTSDNWFLALQNLRLLLEKENIKIICNGSARNVYPSAMQQEFGGTKAHKLYLGQPAQTKDIVDLFDHDKTLEMVSVEEQEKYYKEWLNSLKK